jgi:hypothetical protein
MAAANKKTARSGKQRLIDLFITLAYKTSDGCAIGRRYAPIFGIHRRPAASHECREGIGFIRRGEYLK